MNEKEARELWKEQQGQPIRSRIFRDTRDNTFHTQVGIFDLKFMEEWEGGIEDE